MATPFMFSEKELTILKNFSSINPQLIINPTGFNVINNAKSIIGNYSFDEPYDFEPFGLYETNEFLTVLGAFQSSANITPKEKLVVVGDKDSKVNYYTTAENLLPKVPEVGKKFEALDCELQFSLSGEKLSILNKMASILKSKFIFFESDKKKIRITIADELETSGNNYEIIIDESITANKLEAPVKILLSEFKLLPGDYTVKLSSKISKWQNLNGAIYYISTSV